MDWTGDLKHGWTWDLNSNLSFVSKFYGGLQNDANPQTMFGGYSLLGARASVTVHMADVRGLRRESAQQAI